MIRVDAIWMSTTPCDMRSGMDTLMNQIIAVFGAAQAQAGRLLCILFVWVDEMPAYSERQFVLLDHESLVTGQN